MNSLLIASFKNESSARDAMKKLDDLALNREIDLYERSLIRKTLGGRTELFRKGASAGWQTIAGAAVGSFVGLLGGPVASVIGLMSGAVVGSAISDREQHDFGKEIVKSVESDIPPGTVAIVAHLSERAPELVDSILKRFDSVPFRRDIRNISKGETENSRNYQRT